MSNFHKIHHILGAVFSVQAEFSEKGQEDAFPEQLQVKTWREEFERELIVAFSDPNTSWSELLFNDHYEVWEAESEEDARRFAARLLWASTFPGKPLPMVG